jgi:hypothetical protein
MTAAYFRFAGYSPLAFSTVVNWAKLCLFSIDLSLLLQ